MKALEAFIGLLTHIMAVVFNYQAWVNGSVLCQTVLWMLVPLSFIGLCMPEWGKTMADKVKNPIFWCLFSISLPMQMWIWFADHSHVGFFYGMISLTVTIVSLVFAATYIHKN
jgi:hypothetical protein